MIWLVYTKIFRNFIISKKALYCIFLKKMKEKEEDYKGSEHAFI